MNPCTDPICTYTYQYNKNQPVGKRTSRRDPSVYKIFFWQGIPWKWRMSECHREICILRIVLHADLTPNFLSGFSRLRSLIWLSFLSRLKTVHCSRSNVPGRLLRMKHHGSHAPRARNVRPTKKKLAVLGHHFFHMFVMCLWVPPFQVTGYMLPHPYHPNENHHFWNGCNMWATRKKNILLSYFPLNSGWLMTGSLFHGLWNNLCTGVSEKWWYTQIIHFNRVFHYFHHPFWGTMIFGNTHITG